MELLQDSDSSSGAIGPHWPSSYPEYLSPDWDKAEQRRVVWNRLLSQRSNLARLSKQKERYLALRQELNPRTSQAKSSHDPLYRDIKSNLTTASRAEQVFKAGIPLNRRGECNVPKKYLKLAVYMPEGDEQGYFVYHNGSFIPVEFDFTHCFWYTVKYDDQRSCWVSNKLPPSEYGLNIPDSEVTDRSEWGPIDDGKDSSDEEEEEDAKSIGHPDSIDIKIPTQEEEKSERQLEKLAEHFPILSTSRSHPASSRLLSRTHIFLSYFSVFYTDLFDEVFVFESSSLIMIRWSVMCCHHVHIHHMECHVMSCDLEKVLPCLGRSMCVL